MSEQSSSTTWRIRWANERGGGDAVNTTSLDKAQDVVLDLLRREVEFRVLVTKPKSARA